MKAKITVEIDGKEVATIDTDDLSPEDNQAQYNFDYQQHAAYLICLILADCIDGIENIEAIYEGQNMESLH